ncbi:hypothetical protein GCM10023321_44030 [Pseudonocardia eucalypti]|uniref:DUF320 domain-containing protein n=1 Tax=Pseudonocardia eucalypti TaxID=648755 RepID=A0ABP9QF08_9PSEU|nr:hypothetical protein [Pseudonocardia eucalypti]
MSRTKLFVAGAAVAVLGSLGVAGVAYADSDDSGSPVGGLSTEKAEVADVPLTGVLNGAKTDQLKTDGLPSTDSAGSLTNSLGR